MKQANMLMHLFKTPGGNYVFDVNKNTILKVDECTFNLLHNIKTKGIHGNEKVIEENDFLRNLKENGFLSNNRVEEIIHPKDLILQDHLNNKVEKITLQITQQCNFRCNYCVYSGSYQNRLHSNKRMNFETAKKGIDFLIDHSIDCSRVNIGFYGGEPLLEFELIKKCIDYAVQKAEGKELTFNITSNGTLINEEIIKYFEMHDVSLMISLDGPGEIHDKERKFASDGCGTFSKVIENVEMIRSKFPEYYKKISFNAVMDPENSFNCTNEFFMDFDLVKDIMVTASVVNDKYSKKEINYTDEFFITRGYEVFKLYLSKLGRLDSKYVSRIVAGDFNNLDRHHEYLKPFRRLPEKFHHGGPCIPGAQRLFMDVNGNFFPCERVSESSSKMKIGDIENGFDIPKVKALLNVGKLTEKDCKNCWALTHCSLCAVFADGSEGLSSELKRKSCRNVQLTLEEMFKDYCALREFGYDFDYDNRNKLSFIEEDGND